MIDKLRVLRESASGVTLVETLVALGIMTVTLGLLGSNIFQSLSIERFWMDDVVATREARHAGSWLSGDALNAEEVCYDADPDSDPFSLPNDFQEMPPGGAPVDHVILVWYDVQDPADLPASLCTMAVNPGVYAIHTATYSQSGNELLRTLSTDGAQTSQQVLSQRVALARFYRTPAGDVLKMELDVNAERNSTERLVLDTFLRRLR